MVKESMNAEVANAEEARTAGADALAGVRAEADMGAPRGLARRQAAAGPFTKKKGVRFYVYKVTATDTGEYYYGRSYFRAKPSRDAKYFGSGVWVQEAKKAGRPLGKEVLATFRKLMDAQEHERELIAAAEGDPLNMNRMGRRDFWNNSRWERLVMWVSKEHAALIREYAARLASSATGSKGNG